MSELVAELEMPGQEGSQIEIIIHELNRLGLGGEIVSSTETTSGGSGDEPAYTPEEALSFGYVSNALRVGDATYLTTEHVQAPAYVTPKNIDFKIDLYNRESSFITFEVTAGNLWDPELELTDQFQGRVSSSTKARVKAWKATALNFRPKDRRASSRSAGQGERLHLQKTRREVKYDRAA